LKRLSKGVMIGIVSIFNLINVFTIEGLLEYYDVANITPLVQSFLRIFSSLTLAFVIGYVLLCDNEYKKIYSKISLESVSITISIIILMFYVIHLVAKDWFLWLHVFR